jgi:hypothetical protein
MRRRRERRLAIVAVAIIVVAGASLFPPGPFRAWQEPAVEAALARRLLKGQDVAIAEVTVDRLAPPPSLLARLGDLPYKTRGHVDTGLGRYGLYVDARSGDTVVKCRMGGIRWLNLHEVEMEGAIDAGPHAFTEATYTLSWSFEGWEVTGESGRVGS